MRSTRAVLSVAACLLLATGAAACGDDENESAGEQPAATTQADGGAAAGGGAMETATKAVDEGYKGTFREPPSEGPAAQKGSNVWVISCSEALPGCARPSAAIKEAGKTLGWKVKVFDGKYNVPSFNTGIKQALSAGADAIITVAMDCPVIKQGLTAAKKAKVPTVGLYSYDCSNPAYGGGEELFTTGMNYGAEPTEFFGQWGELSAQYAIAKTEGKTKAILFLGPEFQTTVDKMDAAEKALKACEECEIVSKTPLPATALASGKAAQTVTTTLAKNPDANAVIYAYDAQAFATAQALKRAKRKDLTVVGGEGYFLDLLRAGTVTGAVTTPAEWMGYAGADTANRLIAGETDIPDSGWGFQIVDKENGLPDSGMVVEPPIDYKAAFEKVWTAGA